MSLYGLLCSEECLKKAWNDLQKKASSQGLDEVTIAEFKADLNSQIKLIATELKEERYKPVLLKPHLLAKPEGGYRLIKIPAVRDRVVQRAILNLIEKKLDDKYDINNNGVSFAYTKSGGVQRAAEKIISLWKIGNRYAYKADIEKFFDNIRKDILVDKIEKALLPDKSLLGIIKVFLDNDISNRKYVEAKTGKLYNPNPLVGVAQGSPMSPVFANVYLSQFDKDITAQNLKMVRYADDLVVMCESISVAEDAHRFVKSNLDSLGLKVHELKEPIPKKLWPAKPKYSEIKRVHNLEFLGLIFRSDKVYPSGASYRNALKSVRLAGYDKGKTFVEKINSIDSRVSGWCSAYSFTNREGDKLKHLDESLEEILGHVLRSHGLKTLKGRNATSSLGIKTYTAHLS